MTRQIDANLSAESTWFHVFRSMVENDLATLGPHCFAVYCVIKSCCDFQNGLSYPCMNTIARKAGISERQVAREIKVLEQQGYITKTRLKKNNQYKIREQVLLKNDEGMAAGTASWEYRPIRTQEIVGELKEILRGASPTGTTIHIEHLQIFHSERMQVLTGEGSVGIQINEHEPMKTSDNSHTQGRAHDNWQKTDSYLQKNKVIHRYPPQSHMTP